MFVMPYDVGMNEEDSIVRMSVVGLYGRLKSCSKVAARLGVSPSTIHRNLTALGVKLPSRHSLEVQIRKRKLSPDVELKMVSDYRDGLSMKELKEKYGIGPEPVREAAKRHGIKLRNRGGKVRVFSEIEKEDIVRLYISGLSQELIASKYGAHQITISRIVRSAGVLIHNRTLRKGGRTITSCGYVGMTIPSNHVFASMRNSLGYVPEHRLRMAEHLGRPLLKSESVHHKNGNRKDNRIENLQLRQGKHGSGVVYKCNCCGSTDVSAKDLI